MTDEIDTLLIDVRAGTEGFSRDIASMRASVDGDLVAGFGRAGQALERGLSGAMRRGSLGFEDLRRTALASLDAIAADAARTLGSALGGSGSGSPASGFAASLPGLLTGMLGLPGRATGGNVSPGRGYVVGERGPEVFVPTAAGRIETGPASPRPRDVRVAINMSGPRASSVPASLRRSSRQVASAVRRALAD